MRLHCFGCGKAVSNELPNDTVVRAIATCPECIEAEEDTGDALSDLRAVLVKHNIFIFADVETDTEDPVQVLMRIMDEKTGRPVASIYYSSTIHGGDLAQESKTIIRH